MAAFSEYRLANARNEVHPVLTGTYYDAKAAYPLPVFANKVPAYDSARAAVSKAKDVVRIVFECKKAWKYDLDVKVKDAKIESILDAQVTILEIDGKPHRFCTIVVEQVDRKVTRYAMTTDVEEVVAP